MTYLFKKFIRELLGMRFRGILIILSVGLSIGIYGGLLLVKDNAFASRDDVFKKTNYEDGRLVLYNMIPENQAQSLLNSFVGIKQIDYRLSIDVTLTFKNNNFPSIMHNIHDENRPKINDFQIKKGDFSSLSKHQLIVESRFAEANNMNIGDPVTIKYGDVKFMTTVGAIAFAPEHMYSMNPVTSLPEKGVFAPIWFSINFLVSSLNLSLVINEILFKVNDLNQLDTIIDNLISKLQDNGIYTLGIRYDQEMDYTMMKEDVGTLDKFAVAIGMVILLVAIFIIYDSIMKIIASQKTMIGILRALGASTSALLIHYISFGMVLTLVGILIGIPIGYIITLSSTSIFINAIGFELTANVFRINSFIPSILLALSISFIASLIGTIKIVFIQPVEAINDQTIKQFNKKYIIEGFFDKISKNKYSTKIPVRQVFRRKRRSFLTALTIALAALIILSSFGFLDSFFHQMDDFYNENSVADMEISFVDPIPLQNLTSQIDDISGIRNYEGMVRQPVYIYGNIANETSVVYAYQSNTVMRYYNFKQGSLKPGEIVIGQILARKLDVKVGDEIQLLTRGKTMFDTMELKYRISGITEEFFDNFVFLDLATLQKDFGYGNSINAVAIDISGDPESVQHDLYNTQLPIATIIDLEQSKTSFEALMESVISFAYFVIFLGVIVLILFSLNVIVLDIMDRQREFVNIRINGGSNLVIAKIISLQIFLISLLVLIIDFFLSPAFTQFIIDQTMKNMAYIEFYMTPISYGLSIISFIAGISIGLISAIHNVTSSNIVETMRIRFKN